MKAICVIPSRYASTRLPGKPLKDIAGKPMIVRVLDRAQQAKRIDKALVATDDARIVQAVQACGGEAVMTSKDCQTGTDRLAEVARAYTNYDVVINVQGDEPLIDPVLIDRLAALFADDSELCMATVRTPMHSEAEAQNPNNVKVVCDLQGYALYFSRSLMPYPRQKAPVYKHLGIYAYRRDFLLTFANLPRSPLEIAESLEQLRALENGYRIRVIEAQGSFVGVDTEADLEKVRAIYQQMQK